MPKTFDPKKPCRTLDGRPVRILCTDAAGGYPVVALIELPGMGDVLARADTGGRLLGGIPGTLAAGDLENIPERHSLLVPIAMDPSGKPEAFNPARFQERPRIGHIRVTVEGGRIVGAEILP